MKTHTCAIPGCHVQTQGRMLMCYEHWKLVPKNVKSEVWQWMPVPGREPGSLYQEAVQNAIQAVAQAEAINADQARQIQLL